MKPLCPFGAKCYRKNPAHFIEYRHDAAPTTVTGTARTAGATPPHKKAFFFIDDDGVVATPHDGTHCPGPRGPATAAGADPSGTACASPKKGAPSATVVAAASPPKVSTPLVPGSPALKRSRDETDKEGGDAAAWSGILDAPTPRSSLLTMHPPSATATLLDVYEMAFPVDEMQSILAIAAFLHPTSPLEAFPGWRLVGPFEVLAGTVAAFPTDAAKWRYCRFRYDPPEVQTVAIATVAPHAVTGGGVVRDHLAFHRDEPLQRPGMVVAGSADDATFDILGNSLMGVLLQLMKEGHHAAAAKALGEAVAKGGHSCRGMSETVRARKKQMVATTVHRLGAGVPYDAKTEVGYRPMMMPLAQFKSLVAAWNIKGAAILPKQLDTLTEQFQWADIANDECDFGLNLEIGLNLFSLVVRRNDVLWHTWRVLETVYSLLGRDVFRHILKCHLRTLAGEEAPLLALPSTTA